MPELPEVETTKRMLIERGLIGAVISAAEVSWANSVGGDPKLFGASVCGKRFAKVARRAKMLVLSLTDGYNLVVHLRMSGRLSLTNPTAKRTGYERVILTLHDGRELRFHDTRKFGRFIATKSPNALLDGLAPEPFSSKFTAQYVIRYLSTRSRLLKPLLLDQRALVAGLGNIYTDEALWDAKIHPQRPSDSLTPTECTRLHTSIRTVLQRGIDNLGTSLGTGLTNFRLPSTKTARNQEQLRVFRRTGHKCYRCSTTIKRIIVSQRATHICPHCMRASPLSRGLSQ